MRNALERKAPALQHSGASFSSEVRREIKIREVEITFNVNN